MPAMDHQVIGLFPTPFMRVPFALEPRLVSRLVAHFSTLAHNDNSSSPNLSHTQVLRPADSPLFVEAAVAITPKLADFGLLMMGERLGWSVKVVMGEFNADKWVSPQPQPGDMVLFPSYLMHAVPPNPGPRRISMAFNAIPTRMNSWGYSVSFAG